jgi:hypothetical protein
MAARKAFLVPGSSIIDLDSPEFRIGPTYLSSSGAS